jgi:hypothetical protein
MSNVLSEEKKQQVIALGKLGWPLRRIEQATGVRRETASAYLKTAGVVVGSGSDNVPAPIGKQIGIQSLLSKLSSLLPVDRQLERRARKLAWHLSKGRRVRCDWDYVSLSELTPAENRVSGEDFLALYSDQARTLTKKGGRPRKYRTTAAQRSGHAERQRQYRHRKLVVISDVTKTTSQLAERSAISTS